MERVVSILEQARENVARSVNSNMVIAYWLVGREIVVALQGGEERAEYGESCWEICLNGSQDGSVGVSPSPTCAISGSFTKCLANEPLRFITCRVMNWAL